MGSRPAPSCQISVGGLQVKSIVRSFLGGLSTCGGSGRAGARSQSEAHVHLRAGSHPDTCAGTPGPRGHPWGLLPTGWALG